MNPRVEALARVVARIDGKARWLARLATRAAVAGGVAALVVWWAVSGGRVSVSSLIGLALVAAPAGWLVNVRFALLELVELPEKLTGVATRRTAPPPERPPEGTLGAARSVWGVVRDFGDVVGAWGTVAQLVAPPFWLLTGAAFVAVPVVVVVAAIAGLVRLAS